MIYMIPMDYMSRCDKKRWLISIYKTWSLISSIKRILSGIISKYMIRNLQRCQMSWKLSILPREIILIRVRIWSHREIFQMLIFLIVLLLILIYKETERKLCKLIKTNRIFYRLIRTERNLFRLFKYKMNQKSDLSF
jgi:hypothetical protein